MSDPTGPSDLLPPGGWQPPPAPPPPPFGAPPPPYRTPPPHGAPPGYGAPPPFGAPPPGAPGPWGQPGFPPPAPKRKRWPIALVVVGGVLALLVAIGTVVGTTADEEEAVPVDVEAAVGPEVSTSDFTLTLPGGWIGAEVSGSAEGFGAALFPSEPDLAAAMDGFIANVPRSFQLVAFEEDGIRSQALFVDNLNVFRDQTIPSEMGFDDMMRAQENSFGALGFELVESETIDLDGRRFGRLHARVGAPGGGGGESLVYITEESGDIWILTYSFAEVDAADRALADGSAATIAFD